MPGIFISYRREDSAGHAGRLFDRIRARLGDDRVFMDITGIEAGVDFIDAIEGAVGSCAVLLAIIGPKWLTSADSAGRPRLTDPEDLIRVEICAALTRKVRVIPVLIGGAALPRADQLPDEIKPLVRRQAIEVRDTRWGDDAAQLIDVLEHALALAEHREARRAVGTASTNPGRTSAADYLAAVSGTGDGRSSYPWYRRGTVLAGVAAGVWLVAWLLGAVPPWRQDQTVEQASTPAVAPFEDKVAPRDLAPPVPPAGDRPAAPPTTEPDAAPVNPAVTPVGPPAARGELGGGSGPPPDGSGQAEPNPGGRGTSAKPRVPDVAGLDARRGGSPAPLAVRLLVLYQDDAGQAPAQELLAYLQSLRFAEYRFGRGRPEEPWGTVAYSSKAFERTANALAGRAGPWLTERSGRLVTLTTTLDPKIDGDLVVIRLPKASEEDRRH
jgi:hypothetical protein